MKKLILTIIVFLFVSATAVAANVTFRWNPNSETDLVKYKLYQAETADGPYIKAQVVGEGNLVAIILLADLQNPAIPEYTLTGVADGQHYWVLTAADMSNNESGFSNEVTTIIDSTPPAPPSGLSIWEIIVAFIKYIWSLFA